MRETNSCILHKESRLTMPDSFKKSIKSNHYHISCSSPCFDEHPNIFLDGFNYEIIDEITLEMCKANCLASKKQCLFVEYLFYSDFFEIRLLFSDQSVMI